MSIDNRYHTYGIGRAIHIISRYVSIVRGIGGDNDQLHQVCLIAQYCVYFSENKLSCGI
jgi:hypothetical protein